MDTNNAICDHLDTIQEGKGDDNSHAEIMPYQDTREIDEDETKISEMDKDPPESEINETKINWKVLIITTGKLTFLILIVVNVASQEWSTVFINTCSVLKERMILLFSSINSIF